MRRSLLFKRIATVVAPALTLAACSGQSGPVAPSLSISSVTPAVAGSPYTISGRIVTANNGARPVVDATVAAAGVSTTTDASGRYALTLPGSADRKSVV